MPGLWKAGEMGMTVKEAILTLNANVVFACERAGLSSAAVKMIEDALDTIEDALKANEPRVMTLEDVLKLRFNDVVYFEMAISGVVIPAIVIDVIGHMPDGEIGLLQLRHIQQPTNNADLEYYGKTWRVWDRMPPDEQRGKVKWDSQGLRCALSHS